MYLIYNGDLAAGTAECELWVADTTPGTNLATNIALDPIHPLTTGTIGRGGLTSLAWDATTRQLYSTAPEFSGLTGAYRLQSINLSATYLTAQDTTARTFSSNGPLIDFTLGIGYYNVYGADASDYGGVMYLAARQVDLAPYDSQVDPADGHGVLLTISDSPGTPVIVLARSPLQDTDGTPIENPQALAVLSSAAGDEVFVSAEDADVPGQFVIYNIDPITGQPLIVGGIPVAPYVIVDTGLTPVTYPVTGLEFVDDGAGGYVMYGLANPGLGTADVFYVSLDDTAATAMLLYVGGIDNSVYGSTTQTYTYTGMAAVGTIDDGAIYLGVRGASQSYITRMRANAEPGQDVGAIKIAGSLSGEIYTIRGVELVDIGFLWGNLLAGSHFGDIVLRYGGGGWDAGTAIWAPYSGSEIYAGRDIRLVDVLAETMYAPVTAENDPTVATLGSEIYELEAVYPNSFDFVWQQGYNYRSLLYGILPDITNDVMTDAQFVGSITGDFAIIGLTTNSDPEDWYGFGLMAGQTVVIDGSASIEFYNSFGDLMGTYGWETVEDQGVGSRGSTLQPLVFTAPAAGVYYMRVVSLGVYEIDVTNTHSVSLGAVHTRADLAYSTVAVGSGGSLGVVKVEAIAYGNVVQASAGGNLIVAEAYQMGLLDSASGLIIPNGIYSDSNIGGVLSLDPANAMAVDVQVRQRPVR